MAKQATGTITQTELGFELVVSRTVSLNLAEAWRYVSEPALTALWFGSWQGDGRPGGVIDVFMGFEGDEVPASVMTVLACEAPELLTVQGAAESGGWKISMRLAALASNGQHTRTVVSLVHHLDDTDGVGDIGPGWEYYMDLFAAAAAGQRVAGDAAPAFDEYYPALSAHFTDQVQ